jgi:hypothetical protein
MASLFPCITCIRFISNMGVEDGFQTFNIHKAVLVSVFDGIHTGDSSFVYLVLDAILWTSLPVLKRLFYDTLVCI